MSLVLLTADRYSFQDKKFTFFIYDLNSNQIIYKAPYQKELDCPDLIGQGRSTFRPFGITTSKEYIFISSNKKIGVFDKQTFNFLGVLCDNGVINTHQILYHKEHIYRTNTSSNSISKVNINTSSQTHFCLLTNTPIKNITTPENYNSHDKLHLNSLGYYDKELYIISHNLGNPSELNKIDLNLTKSKKLNNKIGICNHDLNLYNSTFISLSTGTYNISVINLIDNSIKTLPFQPLKEMFLRGSFIKQNYLYFIGNNIKTNPYSPASLIKYDLTNLKYSIQEISNIGIICDIHLLN